MRGAGCYYIPCKNTCVCEVNKLERRFYLVDAQVLPEVFLKVVRAKELLASGEARSISAATRSVDLSRSAFYKYKDCIFRLGEWPRGHHRHGDPAGRDGCIAEPSGRHQCRRCQHRDHQSVYSENGAALVAVTIRTDTMQMTPEELTEKLSRQRMVVGVHCGYNL